MAESINPLVAFSDHVAQLVEHTASSIVAVHGGGRVSSSGIHWRSGVIVTAEEVLERDEDIKVRLPGGRLAGGPGYYLLAGRGRQDIDAAHLPERRHVLRHLLLVRCIHDQVQGVGVVDHRLGLDDDALL